MVPASCPDTRSQDCPERLHGVCPDKVLTGCPGCPDKVLAGCPDNVLSGCPDKVFAACPDKVLSGCLNKALSGCPNEVLASCPDKAITGRSRILECLDKSTGCQEKNANSVIYSDHAHSKRTCRGNSDVSQNTSSLHRRRVKKSTHVNCSTSDSKHDNRNRYVCVYSRTTYILGYASKKIYNIDRKNIVFTFLQCCAPSLP
jgi:hypothetical protein